MEVHRDKNRLSYNRIAKVYAGKGYENSAQEPLEEELTNFKKGGSILDFGSGPGNNFPFLLSLEPRKIVAVDLSENMLEEAKTRYSEHKNIDYVLSSFQDFKTDNKFDLVLAHLSFVHLPKDELQTVLEKIKSMLLDGGTFFANYFGGNDESKEMISDWENEKQVKRDFSFYTQQTLRDIYQKAGLTIYKITKKPGNSFERINVFAKL